MTEDTRLRQLKVQRFQDADPAVALTALQDWLSEQQEGVLVEWQAFDLGGDLCIVVMYATS